MSCDALPPSPPAAECFIYRPGSWEQDIYTLPLEALVVTAISQQHPPSSPRWPFRNESANEIRNPSRQPGMFAAALAGGTLIPLTGSLLIANPKFPALVHLRGLIHSHLWTEFFTSSAKVYFGRKRPFYDTVKRRGEERRDDKLSFFSGHASHSFAFATYASQLAFSELKNSSLAWAYASLLNGTAAWVSASRAIDKQHNWSDVLAGGAVGTAVGYFMHDRVNSVSKSSLNVSFSARSVTFQLELDPR